MPLYTFHVVRSEADLASASELRRSVYRGRLGLDLGEAHEDGERDAQGTVFLLCSAGEPVATARTLATRAPAAELTAIGQLPEALRQTDRCCEVGRLATRRRRGGDSSRHSILLLGWAAQWTLRHTGFESYVAYARLPQMLLWKQLGALDTGARFVLPDRGPVQYGVVTGDIAEVVAAARLLGHPALDEVVSVA